MDYQHEYDKLKNKYESLKTKYRELCNGVGKIFDHYFEDGKNYDPNYSATDAIDDIHSWFD